MKIMFWNIFKVGSGKLKKKLSAIVANGGLGNNIQDYIVKVALGNAIWNNATTTTPVDALVIIELVSGGTQKDVLGYGSCLRVLAALKASMNGAVNNVNYHYDYVPPRVIGTRESVGVLFNDQVLTYVSSQSVRNTALNFIRPRTAFLSKFTYNGNPLNIVGIHGPTSTPQNFRASVVFTNQLGDVAAVNQSALNPKEDLCVGGDYNCDPTSGYPAFQNGHQTQILAFSRLRQMYNYQITLANGTLTSLRNSLNNALPAPANYLSQPYDNIVFQLPSQMVNPPVLRVNLIGNAPMYNTNRVAVFNACRAVSDHLPMTISF
jgi:endonuclease/exonuclease/phosphatase family metal-dependent hydrolase